MMILIVISVSVFVLLLTVVGIILLAAWLRPDNAQVADNPTTDGTSAVSGDRFGLGLDVQSGPMLDAATEHNASQGHYLATACQLAYKSEPEAVPLYRTQLNLHAKLISYDNTQAYVCQNAESIVIAFRGSEKPNSLDGFKDWLLTNARNFLVLPEGRIGTDFAAAGVGARFHRGFMSALAEIWQPLLAEVEHALKGKQRTVWVTGHSLGGAIALLAAWRLHQNFVRVHRIVTFGAPMIGNSAAAEAYRKEFPGQIIRYVDFGDMVPKLPTMSLLTNQYNHVQREIMLGEGAALDANLAFVAAAAEGKDEVDEATATGLWGELHSGISAHLMDNYLARISEQMT